MNNWVENEIEMACKRENPNWDGKSFDYGCAIYQSVLKAYKSLEEDGHSGFSWSMATQILHRLMLGLPLSPITEKDFEGVKPEPWMEDGSIQCPRMSSLFKNKDGTYKDVHRAYCYDIKDPDITFSSGKDKIVDKLFPITLPYYPSVDKYVLECDDGKVLSIKCPDGKVIKGRKHWWQFWRKKLLAYKTIKIKKAKFDGLATYKVPKGFELDKEKENDK